MIRILSLRATICFFIVICISALLTAQSALAASYKLSMLPRYATEEINKRITPLAVYLSKETGLKITPTLTSTFNQYSQQLASGGINIGFENPYIYVLASEAHEVVAMAVKGNTGDKFRGIIITRSDSKIAQLSDLKGKKIAIVGYTSAGGYLSQKLTLLENGIDVKQDCIVEEAQENKQENVIFAVYTGDVDAGFIRESALRKASDFVPSSAIKVLNRSAWLPNWALSISRNMPPEDKENISKAIKKLKSSNPVMKSLKIRELRAAQDSEYDSVRKAAGISKTEPVRKTDGM